MGSRGLQNAIQDIALRRAMILVLAISVQVACGQSTYPLSLPQTAGVHVFAYDNLEHRSTAYYNALFSVVLKEFGVQTKDSH